MEEAEENGGEAAEADEAEGEGEVREEGRGGVYPGDLVPEERERRGLFESLHCSGVAAVPAPPLPLRFGWWSRLCEAKPPPVGCAVALMHFSEGL